MRLLIKMDVLANSQREHHTQQGQHKAARGVAQQATVLQPADCAALSGRECCRTPLDGTRIRAPDELKRPATQQREHQSQRDAETHPQLPGEPRTDHDGRDGCWTIIRIADGADRQPALHANL